MLTAYCSDATSNTKSIILTSEKMSLLFVVNVSFKKRSWLCVMSNGWCKPSAIQNVQHEIAEELHLHLVDIMFL